LLEEGAMDDRELSSIRDIARQMLSNAAFSGLDHAERVRQIAEDIGQREGADLDILRVAALLHDIGVPINKERHYEIGALLAQGILLQFGFTEDEIEPIAHAIEAHSRYGGPDPQTLEGWILQDADAVEYVGATGLARAIVRGLESGHGAWSGPRPRSHCLLESLPRAIGSRDRRQVVTWQTCSLSYFNASVVCSSLPRWDHVCVGSLS
jgi:uncharacterized protein